MEPSPFRRKELIEQYSQIPEFTSDLSDYEYLLIHLQGTLIKSSEHSKFIIRTFKENISKNYGDLHEIEKKRSEKPKLEKLKVKPMQIFVSPYFRDAKKFHPPPHPVSIEKQQRGDIDAYFELPAPWGVTEQKKFQKIVNNAAIESVIIPVHRKLSFLKQKLHTLIESMQDKETLSVFESEINQLQEQIRLLRKAPVSEILNHTDCNLDWLLISGKMMNAGFDRTADACEKMWNNLLCPLINRKRFTAEEDHKLKLLAEDYNKKNWKLIAELLGTNRTAIQCFERYQTHLNKTLMKKFWTQEEDDKLEAVIQQFAVGDYIPWNKVLMYMEGRTILQLQNRWDRCLKPQNRDGVWTPEEDAVLMLAVAVFKSPVWSKIANFLHGRTSYYCRERYTNTLDPEILTGDWSIEEDHHLLRLLGEHGEKWGRISRYFPKRTDNMVNNRLKVLARYNHKTYNDILRDRLAYDFSRLPNKTMAPSKTCPDINNERDIIRQNAFECALKAVKNVCQGRFDLSNCKNFQELGNLMNEGTLQIVAQEILPNSPSELARPFIKYTFTTGIEIKKEENTSEEEDDDGMHRTVVKTEERNFDNFDFEAFRREFECRLLPCAFLGYRSYTPNINLLTRKRGLEYSAMLTYFCKVFDSEVPRELKDEDMVFHKKDYEKTVSRYMDSHVIANNWNVPVPILPFNGASCKALFSLALSKNSFRQLIAQNTLKSSEMYRVISSYKLCYKCRAKSADEEENEDDVCTCSRIEYLRSQWERFLYRFLAAMKYSAILFQTSPSRSQIQELIIKPSVETKKKIQKCLQKKRKRCNDDDDEEEEE